PQRLTAGEMFTLPLPCGWMTSAEFDWVSDWSPPTAAGLTPSSPQLSQMSFSQPESQPVPVGPVTVWVCVVVCDWSAVLPWTMAALASLSLPWLFEVVAPPASPPSPPSQPELQSLLDLSPKSEIAGE